MPKKVKKTKISNVKAEASAVKTVVNVRVGDQYSKKKTVKYRVRRPKDKAAGETGLAIFNRPLPLATQSFAQAQSPVLTNEYNELLRRLEMERRERMATLKPLTPNPTPLTTNEQRNEILRKPDTRTPMTPAIEAFSATQEALVDNETLGTGFENMFIGTTSAIRNIAPKLPVSNFDYNDLETYYDENEMEQEALEEQAQGGKAGKAIQDVRKNITDAFAELGRSRDDSFKQKVVREALGSDYVYGKAPTKYTKLNDVERILTRLRSIIKENPREEKVYAFAASK